MSDQNFTCDKPKNGKNLLDSIRLSLGDVIKILSVALIGITLWRGMEARVARVEEKSESTMSNQQEILDEIRGIRNELNDREHGLPVLHTRLSNVERIINSKQR